jgi:hypothetical protein
MLNEDIKHLSLTCLHLSHQSLEPHIENPLIMSSITPDHTDEDLVDLEPDRDELYDSEATLSPTVSRSNIGEVFVLMFVSFDGDRRLLIRAGETSQFYWTIEEAVEGMNRQRQDDDRYRSLDETSTLYGQPYMRVYARDLDHSYCWWTEVVPKG